MLQNKILGFAVILIWIALSGNPVSARSVERVYWIAADEVQWDYAPSFPVNPMTGNAFDADQRVFLE